MNPNHNAIDSTFSAPISDGTMSGSYVFANKPSNDPPDNAILALTKNMEDDPNDNDYKRDNGEEESDPSDDGISLASENGMDLDDRTLEPVL